MLRVRAPSPSAPQGRGPGGGTGGNLAVRLVPAAAGGGQPEGGPQAAASSQPADDNVVDAEVKEVKKG